MGGLGMGELGIILAIALLVFGAGKLPQVGSSLGKAIRDFRKATSGEEEPEPEREEPAPAEVDSLPAPGLAATQPAKKPVDEAEKR